MAEKLTVAVVGLGRIGWAFHYRETVRSDRFDLVAVADPLPDRVDEAVAGSGCRGYASFDDLIAVETPDVIALATPTPLHEDQTCRALSKGCHVVLEKPMTTSLASADRMIAAAVDAGRHLFVYQPHRLTPETAAVAGTLESGKLGRVFSIKRSVFRFTRRNDWQSLKKNGGGMLNNYGAHYIDQLLHLAGHPEIVDVRCHLWAAATRGDADDVVRVWLKTADNVLLDLEINQASAHTLPGWHVCGNQGTLLRTGNAPFELKYFDPAEAPPLDVVEGAAPGRSYDNRDHLPWREESIAVDGANLDFYANLHDVIHGRAEPYIPVEQTRELMRVMSLCREAAQFD